MRVREVRMLEGDACEEKDDSAGLPCLFIARNETKSVCRRDICLMLDGFSEFPRPVASPIDKLYGELSLLNSPQ